MLTTSLGIDKKKPAMKGSSNILDDLFNKPKVEVKPKEKPDMRPGLKILTDPKNLANLGGSNIPDPEVRPGTRNQKPYSAPKKQSIVIAGKKREVEFDNPPTAADIKDAQDHFFRQDHPEAAKEYDALTTKIKALPRSDPNRATLVSKRNSLMSTGKASEPLPSDSTDRGFIGKVDDAAKVFAAVEQEKRKPLENFRKAVSEKVVQGADYIDKVTGKKPGDEFWKDGSLGAAVRASNPAELSLVTGATKPSDYLKEHDQLENNYLNDKSAENLASGALHLGAPFLDAAGIAGGIAGAPGQLSKLKNLTSNLLKSKGVQTAERSAGEIFNAARVAERQSKVPDLKPVDLTYGADGSVKYVPPKKVVPKIKPLDNPQAEPTEFNLPSNQSPLNAPGEPIVPKHTERQAKGFGSDFNPTFGIEGFGDLPDGVKGFGSDFNPTFGIEGFGDLPDGVKWVGNNLEWHGDPTLDAPFNPYLYPNDIVKKRGTYQSNLTKAKNPPTTPKAVPNQSPLNATPTTPGAPTHFNTGDALWQNAGTDVPVKVTGYLGNKGGKHYVSIEGTNTGIPLDELTYTNPTPKPPQIEAQGQVGAGVDGAKVAASNLSSEAQRQQFGLGDRPKNEPITRASLEANAVDNGTHDLAKNIVLDVEKDGKKARPISAQEQTDLGRVTAQTSTDLQKLHTQVAEGIAKGEDVTDAQRMLDDLASKHETLIKANEYTGTEQSAAFRSRNNAYLDLETPAGVYNEGVIRKGSALSPDETKKLNDLVSKVDEHKAQIDALQNENANLQKAVVDYQRLGAGKPSGGGRRIARSDVEIKARRMDAAERIKKSIEDSKTSSLNANPLIPKELDFKAIADYALTYVEEGVGKVEDIVNLATKALNESGVPVTKDQVQEAMVKWATPKKSQRMLDTQLMLRDRARKEIREALNDLGKTKLQKVIMEASALPRSLQATADLSATLRQGVLLGAGNPLKASVAFGKAMRSMVDPVYYAKLERALWESPMAKVRKQAGLYIADKGGLNLGEESFMSRFVEKLPGIGAITNASERHYVAFLNNLRASTFDDMVSKFPEMGLADQKALADFINVSTGRGRTDFGKVGSQVFFSPRFMASRIEAPLDAIGLTSNGRAMWKSPAARRQLMQSWGSLLGGGSGLLALAKAGGAEVSLDPESPDFGKAKFGNTRFDIWGGFTPAVRLVAGIGKQSKSGDAAKFSQGSADKVMKFFRYKLAPLPNLGIGLLDKKDAVGTPFMVDKEGSMTVKTVTQDSLKTITPLVAKDLWELWNSETTPMPVKITGSVLAPLGVGVNTYKKKGN